MTDPIQPMTINDLPATFPREFVAWLVWHTLDGAVLSEGQVAWAAGLDRIEVRVLRDLGRDVEHLLSEAALRRAIERRKQAVAP